MSVQSLRQFVCDRLTVAAQEILGVFEKKLDDYEAEIIRQRRLNSILSPDLKLHRTELEQQLHSNLETTSCLLPPDSLHIKEEKEETRISPEQQVAQRQKADATELPFPSGETTQSDSSQAFDSDLTANKDVQYSNSNKDVLSITDLQPSSEESVQSGHFMALAPSLPQNEETQANNSNINASSDIELPLSPEESIHHEDLEALVAELTAMQDSDSNTCEPKDLISEKRATPLKRSDNENTLATRTEPTPDKNWNKTTTRTTELKMNEDHTVDSTSTKSAEATSDKSSSDGGAKLISHEKYNDKKRTLKEKNKLTSNRKSQNERPAQMKKYIYEKRLAGPTESRPPNVEKATSTLNIKSAPNDCWGAKALPGRFEPTLNRKSENPTSVPDSESAAQAKAPNRGTNPTKYKVHENATPEGNGEKMLKSKIQDGRLMSAESTHKHIHKKTSAERTELKPHEKTDDGKITPTPRTNEIHSDGSTTQHCTSKMLKTRKRQNKGSASNESIDSMPDRTRMEEIEALRKTTEQTQSAKHNERTTLSRSKDPTPAQEGGNDSRSSNPFKCDRCGKVMSNFKNYKFHMKSHTVEKTYKCNTCGKMFRESWDLNKHLVIHSAVKPFKCKHCGKGFNRQYNLNLHLRVHTGEKPYRCDNCGKSFSTCVNMKKHMRIHTGEKPYTCSHCKKDFADSSAFKNHQRVHSELPQQCVWPCDHERISVLHQENPETSQISEEEEKLCTDQEGEPFVWKQKTDAFLQTDQKVFSDQSLLLDHLQTQKRTTAEEDPLESLCKWVVSESDRIGCGVSCDKQDLRRQDDSQLALVTNVAPKRKKKYDANFDRNLKNKKKNEDEKSAINTELHPRIVHKCDDCATSFSCSKELKVHMRIHNSKKPFECSYCGKMFSYQSILKQHVRIHTGEKPVQCSVCEKRFIQAIELTRHMRTHTGEKPYVCNTCGKKFSFDSNMKRHMRIHTGEKPYACSYCEKEFTDSSSLKYHLRVHTGEKPYECPLCKKTFKVNSTLKKHIRTHTGEKPHNCNICGNNFSQKTHLMEHMRVHTGERPFTCGICGQGFINSINQKRHMKQHEDASMSGF